MTVEAHKETLGFQTEVRQLLKLMIHSLYSNKEIFLRELVSNASDACDKLRFEALTDPSLYDGDSDLSIRIGFDEQARTLTISDNGIGMTRDEVVENIGTIARSGTRQFLENLSGDQAKDANLIGQFGVGFYSAFIVADKVTLVSRRAGVEPGHAVRWESSGEGEYTLETVDKASRGTEVTLHMREDAVEFLHNWRLRNIIQKYSNHITIPILMKKEDADEWERVNEAVALWARPKSEITPEEYDEFYKQTFHDFEPPLTYAHNRVEGKQDYTSLLFLPQRAPFDLWDRERRHGIKLYVRRVFIMDDAEQLMPSYLRFVRGVIDSADLPLNVSREILQSSRDIDAIKTASVKRVLGMLADLSDKEAEKYATFWGQFGNVLKEGIGEDFANKEKIAGLLRFASTHLDTDAQVVSLKDYVSRMKEGQDKIYYVTADTFLAAKNSPLLEVLRKKGIEVLLMYDRIDEWLVSNLTEFDGKPLQSVAKGDLDLGQLEDEAEKQEIEKEAENYKGLVGKIQEVLKDQVKEVRVSHRLTDSPSCLVVGENEMGAHLERLLKAAGQPVTASRPILEINPHHPLVARLNREEGNAQVEDWSHLLFDQALLSEGGQLDDPAAFVRRLNGLLQLLG